MMDTAERLPVDPARLIGDLKTLAGFGKVGTGVNRRALTDIDMQARHWLVDQARSCGLDAHIDGIGSVFARTPSCDRYILIGSHTDTVPNGGWLDGAMGVLYGLEIARAWMQVHGGADSMPVGIEMVSFSDEEGRFHGLMGSGVYSGRIAFEDALSFVSSDGQALTDALSKAQLSDYAVQTLDPDKHIAYFEAHIEQGPVLEAANKRIGAVTSIVGVERMEITWRGQSDHAGTMPMSMRQDAAAALYDFAHRFTEYCRSDGSEQTVWNLGGAQLEPNAYNVVACEAKLLVEYRDSNDEILHCIREFIPSAAQAAADANNASVSMVSTMTTPPAHMASELIAEIQAAAEAHGEPALLMPSGAGHDAMLLAPLIPTAMLFVPSIGGRSHDIIENTSEADIGLGLQVLGSTLDALMSQYSRK